MSRVRVPPGVPGHGVAQERAPAARGGPRPSHCCQPPGATGPGGGGVLSLFRVKPTKSICFVIRDLSPQNHRRYGLYRPQFLNGQVFETFVVKNMPGSCRFEEACAAVSACIDMKMDGYIHTYIYVYVCIVKTIYIQMHADLRLAQALAFVPSFLNSVLHLHTFLLMSTCFCIRVCTMLFASSLTYSYMSYMHTCS